MFLPLPPTTFIVYSMMGEGEVYGTEDLGVGRLPVSDTIQADGNSQKKLNVILTLQVWAKWRNVICIAVPMMKMAIHI